MEREKQKRSFDDVAREAAEYLLQQFWILREKEAEKYQMIREREHVLRDYFLEKLGYRLILHRYFAKLEKIPVQGEAWMGIREFKTPRDYALFCCILAYLEGKSIDEQFLLTDLCEELQSLYPEKGMLDWTNYEHRKSLVRVLQFTQEMSLLKLVDGDVESFKLNEDNEVLYEVSVFSRYFMRSYPKDLSAFKSKEEILEADWGNGENLQAGVKRRHRVYRQLYLSPVVYSQGSQDGDFLYLRNFRNRIREDIEKHTALQFELYKNTAMLTLRERKAIFDIFPDNRAICDIALHFAKLVREKLKEEDIPLQVDGSLCLTRVDFERWVEGCKEQFGMGWSKQYREATIPETSKDLLELLQDWKMASRDIETGTIFLKPLIARLMGDYPKDFLRGKEKEVKNNG